MKRVFLLLILAGLVIISCKKDETANTPEPVPGSDYIQLKIGNYWVYHQYHIDSTGSETFSSIVDSLVITGDTIIRGEKYFKKVHDGDENISYLRDSSGYLVDEKGKVAFSNHDFSNIIRTDTIGPGLALARYRMFDPDTLIQVAIGKFEVLEFRGEITAFDPQYPHGTQFTHYYYADGYGMIKNSCYYFNSPHLRIEQRLVDFGNIFEK